MAIASKKLFALRLVLCVLVLFSLVGCESLKDKAIERENAEFEKELERCHRLSAQKDAKIEKMEEIISELQRKIHELKEKNILLQREIDKLNSQIKRCKKMYETEDASDKKDNISQTPCGK